MRKTEKDGGVRKKKKKKKEGEYEKTQVKKGWI